MSIGESVLDHPAGETKTIRRPLSNRLQQQLANPHYPALVDVRVEANAGHVVIRGRTRSYYHKQLAQSIAMRSDGVESVTNEIEVG